MFSRSCFDPECHESKRFSATSLMPTFALRCFAKTWHIQAPGSEFRGNAEEKITTQSRIKGSVSFSNQARILFQDSTLGEARDPIKEAQLGLVSAQSDIWDGAQSFCPC